MRPFHTPVLATLALLSSAGLASAEKLVERDPGLPKGALVAIASDCAGCHASPDGSSEFSGGLAFATPMGTIYARNITADPKTGIGTWSYEDFEAAVRRGRSKAVGQLYPAMPYTSYRHMSDEDTHALYDYLMYEVAPQDHPIPATDLGFPFLRPGVRIWAAMFATSGRAPDPAITDPQLQRGDYLVNALGHCGECHTTRGMLFQTKSAQDHLAGAVVGGWFAPNITSDPGGIGHWSDDQLKAFLRKGKTKSAVAGGDMGLAVRMSLARLPESDLDAIVAYLKSTTPNPANPTAPVADAVPPLDIPAVEPATLDFEDAMNSGTTDGGVLYQGACASCHGANGALAHGAGPSLVESGAVRAPNPVNVVQSIHSGISLGSLDSARLMPSFKDDLSAAQIAAVATYVRQQFGGISDQVSEAEVNAITVGTQGIPWLLLNARWLAWLGVAGAALVACAALLLILRKRAKQRLAP